MAHLWYQGASSSTTARGPEWYTPRRRESRAHCRRLFISNFGFLQVFFFFSTSSPFGRARLTNGASVIPTTLKFINLHVAPRWRVPQVFGCVNEEASIYLIRSAAPSLGRSPNLVITEQIYFIVANRRRGGAYICHIPHGPIDYVHRVSHKLAALSGSAGENPFVLLFVGLIVKTCDSAFVNLASLMLSDCGCWCM